MEEVMKKGFYYLLNLAMLLALILALGPGQAWAQTETVCEQDVVVQADDWLSKIAEKVYGDVLAFTVIAEATNAKAAVDESYARIDNVDVIEPGWKLCIPSAAEGVAILDQAAAEVNAQLTALGFNSWDEVVAAADGTTVNWFMWGGSDVINANVDEDIGAVLKERYNITLNRVPVADTADAVNKVLDEAAAGVTEGGSVDMIWINGENFKTLRQASLLYGPFAEALPNSRYVNWSDPALAFDFGFPVEGYESPWGHAQFVMEYDSGQVAEVPTTFEALRDWIKANPGKFTYPAIPDFTGSVFIRHLFYWAAGGPEPFLGEFDQATYDQYAPIVWEYLNEIEPSLWREGQTYPEAAVMEGLLANQEIAFNMGYGPVRASLNIGQGIYPDTIRTFVFDTGTLSNNNFVAIPFNASNPAGAMVVADYIISPEFQLIMADPEQWGWLMTIDPRRMPAEAQATLDGYELGPATLPPAVLAGAALPEANGDWVTAFEQGWIENVLEK
jgi:putative spermidine/putrescine transport system substrate-binding protein